MENELVGEHPVVELPDLVLPPPSAAISKARSLALRALVSVLLLVGAVVVALGVVAAGIGLNLLLWEAGRINAGLVLGTLAVIGALGRALIAAIKPPPAPLDEVEVSASAEPELHEAIERLAREVGTRPPDRLVLIPDVNAYVHEFGPLLGLVRGTRTLAIGTPLLDALTVSQLRAVLAHELGHLAGGDTRLGPLAYRTEQVVGNLAVRLAGTVGGRVFASYWNVQHRVSAAVRRGQELVADRAAVHAAGREQAAMALRVVEYTAHGQALLRGSYLQPLLSAGHRPDDLREGLQHVLRERRAELLVALDAPSGPVDPHASHPPTGERIERVAALPETHAGTTDDRAARVLLRDADGWIRAVDERWLDLVTRGGTFERTSWAEWPEIVVAREREVRATVVDSALRDLGLPTGLAGVEAAFTNERERDLAASLVRSGWRTGTADERHQVLRAAIEASAAVEAVGDGSFSWAFSWSGPVALRGPDGEVVELSRLADEATAGDFSALRGALGAPASHGVAAPTARRQLRAEPTAEDAPQAAPPAASPVPAPPQPPFVRSDDAWAAELPGPIGRKARIQIDDGAITLNGERFGLVEVEHLTIGLGAPDSSGFSATIEISSADGRTTKLKMSAATEKGGAPIVRTVDYVWSLAQVAIAPRLSAKLSERIAAGQTVSAGGLELSAAGARAASGRNRTLLPWSSIADPVIEGRSVVIPGFDRKGISVKLDRQDAFLLINAIPELRARFA